MSFKKLFKKCKHVKKKDRYQSQVKGQIYNSMTYMMFDIIDLACAVKWLENNTQYKIKITLKMIILE
jgi:hypothetical protein